MQGSTVRNKISKSLNQSREDQRLAQQARDQAARLHHDCANDLRNSIQTVVQARLGAGSTLTALATADKRVAQLEAQRSNKQAGLAEALTQANHDLAQSRTAQKKAIAARDERKNQWIACQREAMNTLMAEDEQMRGHSERADEYRQQAERLEELADERRARTARLQEQILSDPVFAYCSSRGVFTERHKGNPLMRALDRWVGRISGFDQANATWKEANEQIERVGAYTQRLRQGQVTEEETVAAAVEQMLKLPQRQGIRDAFDQAKTVLARSSVILEAAEEQTASLQQQVELYAQRRDSEARKQQDILFEALTGARAETLVQAALETDGVQDDEAVERIIRLRDELPALKQKLEASEEALQKASSAVERIETLKRKFNSYGYDSSDSRFRSSGNDIDALLLGVMLGRISQGNAWSTLSSGHYEIARTPSYSSSSSSSGFGGGGFSSGGGFGGGGGFSTGGGF